MSIIVLLIILGLIGVVSYALTQYVPMPPSMKTLIICAAVILGVLLLARATGVIDALRGTGVPQVR